MISAILPRTTSLSLGRCCVFVVAAWALALGVCGVSPAMGDPDGAIVRPVESFDESTARVPDAGVRTRAVRLNLSLVDTRLRDDADDLSFELFDDARVSLRLGSEVEHAPGLVSWSGRLGDGNDSAAWYTLTRHRDVLVANFWLGDGRAFEIRPVDDSGEIHLIHEIGVDRFEPCKTCNAAPELEPLLAPSLVEAPAAPPAALGCADDGSVIDVLVVYTPAARNAAGGKSAIQALAASAIQSTNQAYLNSNIQTTVRLAHVAEVNYAESGSYNTDLVNLRIGLVPDALSLREAYDADLVAMLNDIPGGCGIGYLMSNLSTGFEAFAFSVTRYSCAVGNLTFAHELGHNMGCHHDFQNAGSTPLFVYSYGWRWTTNQGQLRRSVMAYSPGVRLPHFSNPVVFNGGVPTGDVFSANNALSTNNAAFVVSNFRCGTTSTPSCPGDLNGSNGVDSADLGILLNAFGTQCEDCPADINGDGVVNSADLGILLAAFGTSCP